MAGTGLTHGAGLNAEAGTGLLDVVLRKVCWYQVPLASIAGVVEGRNTRAFMVSSAISLRTCYGMPGTDKSVHARAMRCPKLLA
eukprot:3455408-Rhodomonas_salina.3